MNPAGYNPMRWNCLENGCFNHKLRPKIEVFSDCFPGRINFGDVDGIVEINGNALLLEWKAEMRQIPWGQAIMYSRLTADGSMTALILAGNARDMSVAHGCVARHGKIGNWKPCCLEQAKSFIRKWCCFAQKNSRLPKPKLEVVPGEYLA